MVRREVGGLLGRVSAGAVVLGVRRVELVGAVVEDVLGLGVFGHDMLQCDPKRIASPSRTVAPSVGVGGRLEQGVHLHADAVKVGEIGFLPSAATSHLRLTAVTRHPFAVAKGVEAHI